MCSFMYVRSDLTTIVNIEGAGQEASRLKLQLQDALAGKSIAEDMSGALQVWFGFIFLTFVHFCLTAQFLSRGSIWNQFTGFYKGLI